MITIIMIIITIKITILIIIVITITIKDMIKTSTYSSFSKLAFYDYQ